MTKKFAVAAAALAALFCCQFAMAADAGCEARSAEKKLAGAAKNSFMKKCEADAAKKTAEDSCQATAADKKLKGAAKNSFVKKCVSDATQAAK